MEGGGRGTPDGTPPGHRRTRRTDGRTDGGTGGRTDGRRRNICHDFAQATEGSFHSPAHAASPRPLARTNETKRFPGWGHSALTPTQPPYFLSTNFRAILILPILMMCLVSLGELLFQLPRLFWICMEWICPDSSSDPHMFW